MKNETEGTNRRGARAARSLATEAASQAICAPTSARRRPATKNRIALFELLLLIALTGLLLIMEPFSIPRRVGTQVKDPLSAGASSAAASTGTLLGAQPRMAEAYGKLPLSFEVNRGQADRPVRFLSRGRGYSLFLTGDEAVLALRGNGEGSLLNGRGKGPREKALPSVPGTRVFSDFLRSPAAALETAPARKGRLAGMQPAKSAALRMKLAGANPHPHVTGLGRLPGRSNYFIGSDPAKWRTNIPNYSKVRYQDVYPGIDLVYYGNQRQLEYDFVVAPGADPKAVELSIAGADQIALDGQNNLLVTMEGGEIRFDKPVIYQPQGPKLNGPDRKAIDGRYVLLAENRIGFEVTAYDPTRPLIIDPVLSYSTYLGGSYYGRGNDIAVDSSGNAYVTGSTESDDFPILNAIQTSRPSGTCGTTDNIHPCADVFIAKLNAAGDALVYSTYLGGGDDDWGYGITVDSSGVVYVTGETLSSDFPLHPPSNNYSGNGDIFLTKLSSDGSALLQSSYFGTSRYEAGNDLAVDGDGNVALVGEEESTAGDLDGFLMIVRGDGSGWSHEPIGGSDIDQAEGVAWASSGGIYVVGTTYSSDFTTNGPFQSALSGGTCDAPCPDAFVRKYLPTGGFTYSTYLGGSSFENGWDIAVDSSENIYVTGVTFSTDFPTVNAYRDNLDSIADVFVTKFNAGGGTLAYSTYIGSGTGRGIAVDSTTGSAFVTGDAASNFPTVNAIQPDWGYYYFDAFLLKLSPSGSQLAFSTYLGGSDDDYGYRLALDSDGSAYVVGATRSSDFPTANALQPALAGERSAFITKVSFAGVSLSPSSLDFGSQTVGSTSPAKTVTLSNNESTALTIASVTAGGDFHQTNTCGGSLAGTSSCTISITFQPTAAGTRTGELKITSSDAGSPHVVSLTGTGFSGPFVSLSPASLDFGSQMVGSASAAKSVTLNNTGSEILNITSIQATDPFTQTNNCGSTVAVGGNCALSITFQPTSEGTVAGQVTVTDNAADSPQTIILTGKGVVFGVELSPQALDFGSQLAGTTSSSQTVTLANTGSASLTVAGVGVNGDADHFQFNAQDCMNQNPLAPAGTCQIEVTFTPQAVGAKTATLQVTSDAPDSPHEANLTGTGSDFAVNVASGSSTSSTVSAGQTASYDLAVDPSGFSGGVSMACSWPGGQPRGAACSISPASVNLNGTTPANVTVQVTTTARSLLLPKMRTLPPPTRPAPGVPQALWWAVFVLLLLALAAARRRPAYATLASLLFLVVLWAACGGGGSSSTPTPTPTPTGTPAGMYTLAVTGTASGMSHTTNLTLTVQ